MSWIATFTLSSLTAFQRVGTILIIYIISFLSVLLFLLYREGGNQDSESWINLPSHPTTESGLESRWSNRTCIPSYHSACKTPNSGLRSKEEKPHDPINQSSRCNTQEGLLSVVQTGWLWSPGRQSTPNSKLGKLFIDKNHTISILHTG